MNYPFFSGDERLAVFGPMNKPMRMGNPKSLLVSDSTRFLEKIEGEDYDTAKDYLDLFKSAAEGMVALSTQWCLSCTVTLNTITDDSLNILLEGHNTFKKNTQDLRKENIGQNVAEHFDSIMDPQILTYSNVKGVQEAINKGEMEWISKFNEISTKYFTETVSHIKSKNKEAVVDSFHQYRSATLILHDLIFEYVSAIADTCGHRTDDKTAKQLIQKSFGEMPAIEGIWQAIKDWAPEEVAAWLSEHLRDHFSGPNRDGSVRIEEDDQKISLYFEPCGSGGAIRGRHEKKGTTPYKFKNPCPQTWNKTNEVPAYCSHCAVNELASMKHVGYPMWVTEFNADSTKPCGWTIYKRKEDIPAHYYHRLGYKKMDS